MFAVAIIKFMCPVGGMIKINVDFSYAYCYFSRNNLLASRIQEGAGYGDFFFA